MSVHFYTGTRVFNESLACRQKWWPKLLGIVAGITKLGKQVGEQVAKNSKLK